jgi:hypothetical protein
MTILNNFVQQFGVVKVGRFKIKTFNEKNYFKHYYSYERCDFQSTNTKIKSDLDSVYCAHYIELYDNDPYETIDKRCYIAWNVILNDKIIRTYRNYCQCQVCQLHWLNPLKYLRNKTKYGCLNNQSQNITQCVLRDTIEYTQKLTK